MDQELRTYLEELEARMEARADVRFAQLQTQMETEGRQTRVLILEAKADRQTEDVLESIRKKFGKTQA